MGSDTPIFCALRHIEVIITDIVTVVTNYFTILLIAPASGSVAMT